MCLQELGHGFDIMIMNEFESSSHNLAIVPVLCFIINYNCHYKCNCNYGTIFLVSVVKDTIVKKLICIGLDAIIKDFTVK